MNKISIALVTIMLLSSCFVSCKKTNSDNICKYDAMPSSLILKFLKNGVKVSDLILKDLKLSYYEANTKKYVSDFSINNLETSYQNMGLITTRLIGVLSADNNIKTFFIEYPNSWPSDTLYVDYSPRSNTNGCQYVQQPCKCNSQLCLIDNSFNFDSPVYVLNKP